MLCNTFYERYCYRFVNSVGEFNQKAKYKICLGYRIKEIKESCLFLVSTSKSSSCNLNITLVVNENEWERKVRDDVLKQTSYIPINNSEYLNYKSDYNIKKDEMVAYLSDIKYEELLSLRKTKCLHSERKYTYNAEIKKTLDFLNDREVEFYSQNKSKNIEKIISNLELS